MLESVNEIKNYILFLKKQCKLEITLHPKGNERFITSSGLLAFNIHENSYCIFIKSFPQAYDHCILRQVKIKEKCREEGSFCGTCYAGVKEFVYPIISGKSTVGFICVSGYKDSNGDSYVKKSSERFCIPIDAQKKAYINLKSKIPDKTYVDLLIYPLIRMLELAYIKFNETEAEQGIVGKIMCYVNRYYTKDITLDDICNEFYCSRSFVSHIFKKTTGQSFREYLTETRIRAAKILLEHSNLKITEIALSVGFNDSNYFSSVFRAYTGFSPRAYRCKKQAT